MTTITLMLLLSCFLLGTVAYFLLDRQWGMALLTLILLGVLSGVTLKAIDLCFDVDKSELCKEGL